MSKATLDCCLRWRTGHTIQERTFHPANTATGHQQLMTWLTELVDIHRFPTCDHLGRSVGLVPGKPSSADREPPGTRDHRGNPRLRTLLIENSWLAKQKEPVLLARYEHLTRRMVGKNAMIRIGRILLRRMRAVLLTHQPYEYGRAQ